MAKKKLTKVDIGVARTYGQADNQIAFLVEKYLERHPNCFEEDGSIDLEAILDWAIESRIYQPKPVDPRAQLRRRVRRHFGHRYIRDPKGRDVRALIAVQVEQETPKGPKTSFKYFPLFDTDADIIYSGLDLRRKWAYKRVEQIHTDHESYQEFNRVGQKLKPMSFNFDEVLARKDMPTTYPKSAPPDADDEDDKKDDDDDPSLD